LRTPTAPSTTRGVLALFGAVALLAVTVTMAQAADNGEISGSGGGTGFETPGHVLTGNDQCDLFPLQGTFPHSQFDLEHSGTYHGVGANGQDVATYAGTTSVNLVTEQYVISPEGTYTECGVPGAVEVHGNINSPTNVPGKVNCGPLNGLFMRRAFIQVTFVLEGPCTVQGNQPGSVGQVVDTLTQHVITGTMVPCGIDPAPPLPIPTLPPVPNECELAQLGAEPAAFLVTNYVVNPMPQQ